MKFQLILLFGYPLLPLQDAVAAIHGRRHSWSTRRGLDLLHDDSNNKLELLPSTTPLLVVSDDKKRNENEPGRHNIPIVAAATLTSSSSSAPIYQTIRGGVSCSDSTPRLFAKIGLGAAVETSLMTALLNLVVAVQSNKAGYYAIKAIVQTIVLLSVIFGSSTFGDLVDRGLSAATKQILDPNRIPGDASWYASLKKPRWNPPGWVFPIMWLIVSKPTQFLAVSKLLAASTTNRSELSIPLLAYCTHLSLGDSWNKVFFGLECTGRGLAVMFSFWSALWICAYLFYRVDQTAGLLLLPTCLWVTVATALNWSIYHLNKQE